MNISAFNQMIASRRSIYPKDYKNEKIEDEIVWQILKNAHWAPTTMMPVPIQPNIFLAPIAPKGNTKTVLVNQNVLIVALENSA